MVAEMNNEKLNAFIHIKNTCHFDSVLQQSMHIFTCVSCIHTMGLEQY